MGLFFHIVLQRNCAPYGSYDKCNPPMLRERTARIMIGQNARVYGDIKDRSLHHNNEQELFTNYFNNNLSRVSLARARSLFRPLLLSACYAGYPFYCSFSARCMYHHQDPFKWLRLFNYSGNYFGLIKPFPNIVQAENSSKI